MPDRRPNSVRATIAWSGAHGPTSMLSQVALPANAFVTDVVSTATAGDPGGGMTVGSVTDPDQFVAAVAYTTAKIAHALVTKLPDGVAANDLNLVVDPGTSNYTGSIETEVFYSLAQ